MSKKLLLSLIKGNTFSFKESGNYIEAWCSSVSGREKVFVNGKLVTSKIKLSFKTSQNFVIDGVEYSISYQTKDLMRSASICMLFKEGKEVARQSLGYFRTKKVLSAKAIIFGVLLMFGSDILISFMNLPLIFHLVQSYLGLLFLLVVWYQVYHIEARIKDEQIV